MYRLALRPSAVSRLLPAVVAVFALASLFSYANPASLYEFNSVQRFAESLLIIGLVLLYFYKVIRELVIVHLEREPLFWVSVGLLLYFSGNVFIFVSSNYVLQHSKSLSLRLWNIHELLYMVLYGLYAWALWMKPSTQRL
jgi:ABC-type bacteriocin/lantibiotic exporter with double-glycine peptidase domain